MGGKKGAGDGLAAHWPFRGDCRDVSGSGTVMLNRGVTFDREGPRGTREGAACFDGNSWIRVSARPALGFGTEAFTIAAFIRTEEATDVVGDLVSKFDPATRKGLNFSVVTNGGVTSTAQPNRRSVHFGIDDGRMEDEWKDHGRLGNAVMISSLAVCKKELWAGTAEMGRDGRGHLWNWDGSVWRDLGSPDGAGGVCSLIEFDDSLFLSTSVFGAEGSQMGRTENSTPGCIYRMGKDGLLKKCGRRGVAALTVFRGELYGLSRGVVKYEGGDRWKTVGPSVDRGFFSLAVYRGHLYALGNGGPLLRYEGDSVWSSCGCPSSVMQMYSAAIHRGNLYVGTWPHAELFRVFAPDSKEDWRSVGRVIYETEIMGMALCNGKLYAGSLPTGSVWRYDQHRESTTDANPVTVQHMVQHMAFMGNLERAPVCLKRVWPMAVYAGRLFTGTLPSGHVFSREFGKMATMDAVLPSGWHHLAAVKGEGKLRVFLDGKMVAQSSGFSPQEYNLTDDFPLLIGNGMHTPFQGAMSDLRIYRRALNPVEMAGLARAGWKSGRS